MKNTEPTVMKYPLRVSATFLEAVDAWRRRIVVEGGPLLNRSDAIRALVEQAAAEEFASVRSSRTSSAA